MKASTLALLALAGFGVWALTLRRDPTYTGVAIDRDTGWNLPPIYPDVTGSGAIDPTGSAWPGWQTPPFNPEGWPGGIPANAAGAVTLPSNQVYAAPLTPDQSAATARYTVQVSNADFVEQMRADGVAESTIAAMVEIRSPWIDPELR